MILEKTQVVCKKCSKVLTVDNPKGLRSAFCICGICKSRIEVNFWVEDKNMDTSLHDESGGMMTSLPQMDKVLEHTASLLVEDHEYQLSIGNNIVGRWSPVSQADVQLYAQDDFLSRQHVQINVYRLADGKLRITVKNNKNKNETLVKGEDLGNYTLVVKDGDTIMRGNTEAKLIVKPSSQ